MLKNLKIRSQLYLLIIVSAVAFLIMMIGMLSSDMKRASSYENLYKVVLLSTQASILLHETQKERGATAGYLGSKGKNFKEILFNQRKQTNLKISQMKKLVASIDISQLDKNIQMTLKNALYTLKSIGEVRGKVDSLSIKTSKAINYYTMMNNKFLDLVLESSKISQSPDITKDFVAYTNFLLSKERAGIERAVGSNTLARDNFAPGMRVKLNNLISAQNSYMENFLKYASDDSKKFYTKTVVGKSIDEINRLRNVLLNSSKKKEIVSQMKELAGYGGLIHNFKNYVIRGLSKYEPKIKSQYVHMMELIDEYKALDNVSDDEKRLLNDIESVFTKYFNGVAQVSKAIKSKSSVKQLDKIVKVNDTPAINALNKLDNSFFTDSAEYWFEVVTKKINKLKQVDDYLSKNLIQKTKNKIDELQTLIILKSLSILLFIIIILSIGYLIISNIIDSLNSLEIGIKNFFKFLNREINDLKIPITKSNDEINDIKKLLNNEATKIVINLQKDLGVYGEIMSFAEKMSAGNFSARICLKADNPRINHVTNSLNGFANKLQKNSDEILFVLDKYSNYNYLDMVSTKGLDGYLLRLAENTNFLGNSINEMLVDNKKNGLTLDSSSQILLQNVDDLNKNANEAATSLEQTAAALEEITSNISNNTENVIKMAQYASKLSDSSNEGKELASKTTRAMSNINEEVNSINEAITIIDQIAFQTNILSLNAAVEAATAGEAGKGFAVVAQEVRNLASRSAEAANDIKALVENAKRRANEGKDISKKMIEGYSNLNDNISQTLELISSIEIASKEQQSGIIQVNDTVNALDQKTQQNASIAAEANSIAVQTDQIAKLVLTNVNEKEFKGKNEIQLESLEQTTSKKNINSDGTIINNFTKDNTDTWESF